MRARRHIKPIECKGRIREADGSERNPAKCDAVRRQIARQHQNYGNATTCPPSTRMVAPVM
jgi:hypothetical protein